MSVPPTADAPVRVAVVNDFELVVAGVHAMLSGDPRITPVELRDATSGAGPVDVVLYDTFGQRWHDEAHLRELVGSGDAKIVVFTWTFEPDAVERAFAFGVSGYLSKGIGATALGDAIVSVAAGERITGRELVQVDDDLDQPPGWPGRQHGLSAREAEILSFITQGLTNHEIAAAMYLSINSVKTYIRTAYRKIGIERRSQAVRYGMEHGYEPQRTSSVP